MIIEIDDFNVSKCDVGERILREYEKGEISTRRSYELLKQLFDGRKKWNLDAIWERESK
jgi:hypothetical protein